MTTNTKSDSPAQMTGARRGLIGNASTIVSKAASLAILATLALVAWVAFSFVRISLAGDAPPVSAHADAALPAKKPENQGSSNLSQKDSLVYISDGDAQHYHQCGHNPTGNERQAVVPALARTRGLTPCPACFKE